MWYRLSAFVQIPDGVKFPRNDYEFLEWLLDEESESVSYIEGLTLVPESSEIPDELIETMSRGRFQSLSQSEQDVWVQRLNDQWGLRPTGIAQLWFSGDRIVGVERYKTDAQGRRYSDGSGAASELLGRFA